MTASTVIASEATSPRPSLIDAETTPLVELRPGAPTTRALWGGRLMSGVAVLFLGFDAAMKVLALTPASDSEATSQLGWPASAVFPLGLLEVACWVLYVIPRTAVLGALLWTGYLGGAVATHVRVSDPLFSHQLFPIYVALLLWGGLWLREPRLRSLLPLRADRRR